MDTEINSIVNSTDPLAEMVWNDLKGAVPIAQVRQVTDALQARYDDARIRVFIPIIIRRQAVEMLQSPLLAASLDGMTR